MQHFSNKSPLTIDALDFSLLGVSIQRGPGPWLEHKPVAGPYYGDEAELLRGALARHVGHMLGLAIREERSGISIYRLR